MIDTNKLPISQLSQTAWRFIKKPLLSGIGNEIPVKPVSLFLLVQIMAFIQFILTRCSSFIFIPSSSQLQLRMAQEQRHQHINTVYRWRYCIFYYFVFICNLPMQAGTTIKILNYNNLTNISSSAASAANVWHSILLHLMVQQRACLCLYCCWTTGFQYIFAPDWLQIKPKWWNYTYSFTYFVGLPWCLSVFFCFQYCYFLPPPMRLYFLLCLFDSCSITQKLLNRFSQNSVERCYIFATEEPVRFWW